MRRRRRSRRSYKELIDNLKNGTDLNTVAVRETTIVYGTTGDRLDTWQLPPLSAALLRLCDGKHTVAEIARLFHPSGSELDGILAEKVCLFGLMQLKEDGLIGLSASSLTWDEPAARKPASLTVAPHYSLPPQATHTQQPWPH